MWGTCVPSSDWALERAFLPHTGRREHQQVLADSGQGGVRARRTGTPEGGVYPLPRIGAHMASVLWT